MGGKTRILELGFEGSHRVNLWEDFSVFWASFAVEFLAGRITKERRNSHYLGVFWGGWKDSKPFMGLCGFVVGRP